MDEKPATCFCNDTGFIIICKRVWRSNEYLDFAIVKELIRCPNEKCTHGFGYREPSEHAIPNEIPEFYKL